MKRTKRSDIWSFFTERPGSKPRATCNFCMKPYSYSGSSTSNLNRHITIVHPQLAKDLVSDSRVCRPTQMDMSPLPIPTPSHRHTPSPDFTTTPTSPGAATTTVTENQTLQHPSSSRPQAFHRPASPPPTSSVQHSPSDSPPASHQREQQVPQPRGIKRQTAMSQYTNRALTATTQKTIDDCLFNFIIGDMQAFRVVESPHLKQFVSKLNPSYQLPSRKVLSNRMLAVRYEDLKYKIQPWRVYRQCLLPQTPGHQRPTATLYR